MYPNLLYKRTKLSPNRIGLQFENKDWTFQQLFHESINFAEKLHAKGIQKNDRIAILASSSPELVIALHGCLQLGCELVLLNERLTKEELTYQLRDSAPTALLVDSYTKRQLSYDQLFSMEELRNQADRKSFQLEEEWPKDRVVSIMYTSGTTGRPKGVCQSIENHVMNAMGSALNLGVQPNDCWLCAMPLFHISGFSILMRSVLYGMTVLLQSKFDEESAVDAILSGGVTRMSVVSVTLERILTVLEERDISFPTSFRSMLVGGGPVPRAYLERAIKRNIPVLQTYGMTETASQTTTLASEDAIRKLGSAGKPLFFAEVKIDGQEEIGEICIKGPHVTKGYVGEHADKSPLIDGRLHTGDIGYLDEEGYLYVVDRRSDLIISGGENIYPAELENVLAKHPAVKEVGVIGKEDETWGQVPIAFLVLKEHATEEELKEFAKDRLASYKRPAAYYFLKALPRNASNKLLRRKLKEFV